MRIDRPPSAIGFNSLPPELLTQVAELLDRQSLQNLRLVDRNCYYAATGLLFSHVSLSPVERYAERLRTVVERLSEHESSNSLTSLRFNHAGWTTSRADTYASFSNSIFTDTLRQLANIKIVTIRRFCGGTALHQESTSNHGPRQVNACNTIDLLPTLQPSAILINSGKCGTCAFTSQIFHQISSGVEWETPLEPKTPLGLVEIDIRLHKMSLSNSAEDMRACRQMLQATKDSIQRIRLTLDTCFTEPDPLCMIANKPHCSFGALFKDLLLKDLRHLLLYGVKYKPQDLGPFLVAHQTSLKQLHIGQWICSGTLPLPKDIFELAACAPGAALAVLSLEHYQTGMGCELALEPERNASWAVRATDLFNFYADGLDRNTVLHAIGEPVKYATSTSARNQASGGCGGVHTHANKPHLPCKNSSCVDHHRSHTDPFPTCPIVEPLGRHYKLLKKGAEIKSSQLKRLCNRTTHGCPHEPPNNRDRECANSLRCMVGLRNYWTLRSGDTELHVGWHDTHFVRYRQLPFLSTRDNQLGRDTMTLALDDIAEVVCGDGLVRFLRDILEDGELSPERALDPVFQDMHPTPRFMNGYQFDFCETRLAGFTARLERLRTRCHI